jgi:hypothetical protein
MQDKLYGQTTPIKPCQWTWSQTAVLHPMQYSVSVPLISLQSINIEMELQYLSLSFGILQGFLDEYRTSQGVTIQKTREHRFPNTNKL